ncbi:unnamed protein product [Mycena citricolor]|uniref:Uncharacterized protein n=1 Tax=Mycena citricolor TaxID=2018698 RepID=A0AAD2HDB1_9AGAR|nr:unnamed protein product [Mycena citricolor]
MPSKFTNFFKRMSKSDKPAETKAEEPAFSIQPHPAASHIVDSAVMFLTLAHLQKSNDPADLAPPTGGLASNPNEQALHARDPHIPSAQVMAGMEQPSSREELKARQAELNKD